MAFLSSYYNHTIQKAESYSKNFYLLKPAVCGAEWSCSEFGTGRPGSPSSSIGHMVRASLMDVKHLKILVCVLGFGSVASRTPECQAGGPENWQTCLLLETFIMGFLES